MKEIPTARAAYLIPFIDVLRDVGAPVERELARARLPVSIEEAPDELINNILAIEFACENEHSQGLEDFGWLWAERFDSSAFSHELQSALSPLLTVKSRIDRFSELSRLEDSDVQVGLYQSNGQVHAYCDVTPPGGVSGFHISEWTQVMVLVEIVRGIAGRQWCPDTINFRSDFDVCEAANLTFPNTRFVKQAQCTSIVFPEYLLIVSSVNLAVCKTTGSDRALSASKLDRYRGLLRPYLFGASPKISMYAEIVGESPRTLQRNLQRAGLSFTELVETTRFELATEMLNKSDMKLIDVAVTLGYENQSNFGRSFRRVAGVAPGKYRAQMQLAGNAG